MKKILGLLFLSLSTLANASDASIDKLMGEVKKNFGNEQYALELGQYLHNKSDKEKLIVKEALRHTYITSSMNRNAAMDMMVKSSLIDLKEKKEIENQLNTYESIVSNFKNNVSGIKKDESYTGYRCDGVESRLTDMNTIVPFKRNIRISDVSAYQDFIQYFNRQDIVITHVPSASAVVNYVRTNTRIKFINIEEKIIANNATAVSMYSSVSNSERIYLMFPYKLTVEDNDSLSDLTARQYGYYALNLSLTGRLTPEIYKAFNRIYNRNASLCLYANE